MKFSNIISISILRMYGVTSFAPNSYTMDVVISSKKNTAGANKRNRHDASGGVWGSSYRHRKRYNHNTNMFLWLHLKQNKKKTSFAVKQSDGDDDDDDDVTAAVTTTRRAEYGRRRRRRRRRREEGFPPKHYVLIED
jgi:hypothetical protein